MQAHALQLKMFSLQNDSKTGYNIKDLLKLMVRRKLQGIQTEVSVLNFQPVSSMAVLILL